VIPYVIQVTAKFNGVEYPAVMRLDMVRRPRNTEILPLWRLVPVPPEFASCDPTEILQACYDGRIAWAA